MIPLRSLALLLLTLCAVVLAQAPTPTSPALPATVQGIVVESVGGRPLGRATVQLRGYSVGPVGARGGAAITPIFLAADTRDDGTFAFRNVPPARYSIEAMRAGYIPGVHGERTDPYATPTQELTPGQILSGVRMTLTPGGVIYGRLVDDHGDSVVGATVRALKTTFENGRRERLTAQSVITNDLGEYRLFMLPPGEYHIAAFQAPIGGTLLRTLDSPFPLYYPGTIDFKEAQSIALRAGELRGGVDFLSVPTRTRKVSGNLQGNGGDDAQVILSPRNGTTSLRRPVNAGEGTFAFNEVIPGSYMLGARTMNLSAALPVDVRNADVLGLRVALGAGFRIPVHVRIDGHPPGDDPDLEKLYFEIRPVPPVPGLDPETYSPFANGRFALDVLTGDYRIDLVRTQDFYVKSMTLGGVDVFGPGLHATSSPDTPIEILVGDNPGSVEGRAEGNGATVVLVPEPSRRLQEALYKFKKVGASGEFRFDKIPPGDYKLFAWTEENGGPWLEPEYVQRFEERGTSVRVEAGKKTALTTTLPALAATP